MATKTKPDKKTGGATKLKPEGLEPPPVKITDPVDGDIVDGFDEEDEEITDPIDDDIVDDFEEEDDVDEVLGLILAKIKTLSGVTEAHVPVIREIIATLEGLSVGKAGA